MHRQTLTAWATFLVGLCIAMAAPTDAADDDAKPTTIEELDKLPVGLNVVHEPNPVLATETGESKRRGKYTWWFKTTVSSTGQDVKVVEFGAYVWQDKKWPARQRGGDHGAEGRNRSKETEGQEVAYRVLVARSTLP